MFWTFEENVRVGERLHRAAHDLDPEEEHAEREYRFADGFDVFFFGNETEEKSGGDEDVNVIAEMEGDDLCRYRRSDVRAENNRDRLRQVHQSGADKADRHHADGAGRLKHRGDQHSGDYAHHGVFSERGKYLPHPGAGRFLDALAHHRHPEQEDSEAADEAENYF